MSRISYSQFSKWDKCPYTWKLDYVDKAETFVGNIYTLFGTAIHETIQAYLVAYYGKTIKYADSLPLNDILQYRMEENYKKSKEQHGDDFDVSLEDMKSFFQDGINIIDEFLKRKSSHFPKKNTELVGIELDIKSELENKLTFVGYMDVVIHNKVTGRIKIIDIKTATFGWNKYQKADKNKTNQLLLYKKFFSDTTDIPMDKIDIEYLILKRKLYENIQYPQKRLQVFSPASGKPSINKVMSRLDEFMAECYDENGKIIAHDYEKCEKHKKCRLCKDL
jgi:hypothetical protein|tara:strand:+ start:1079 stop:1912 length:834 start_codon:yes stop_codon:yes gene_type:complete